ncbi:MAG: hypothetical protein ACLTG4_07025 [Oscillospiraceae bacterium]
MRRGPCYLPVPDNTTPATVAQQNGVFHVGYNNDMTGTSRGFPSSRIDWSVTSSMCLTAS